jgi:hypothetical protein
VHSIQSALWTGNQKRRACSGEDDLLRRKFSALHYQRCPPVRSVSSVPQCCPPPVSAPFPPCSNAAHCQCPLRFLVPQCCPPSVSAPFLRAPVLPTVSARSVSSVPKCCPPCPSAVHRQLPFRFSVPHCCPPSVSVPFLHAPVLSTVSARSVSPCTETKSEGSAVSLMLERTCFSFQSNEEKWLEWGHCL